MFLATTALSEFWDTTDRMVYLERRCLPAEQLVEQGNGVDDVLPNPWADRERFQRAATYLDRSGEYLIRELAEYMNTVHGRSCSHRYWRVVLGNWLINFLHAAYDRYVRLNEAFARHTNLRTLVLAQEYSRVPRNTNEMVVDLKNSDLLNLQLMSHLLLAMGYTFEGRRPREDRGPKKAARHSALRRARRLAHRFAETAVRSLHGPGADATLYSMEVMDHAAVWRLALASRFRIVPLAPRASGPEVPATFDDRRLGLGSLKAEDSFQRAALTCLPHYLPTVFLEGYQETKRRALAGWRRMPRVIMTATGWNYHDEFQLFAAEAVDAGTRLVSVQHGAGYGYSREWPSERHERRLSDTFIAWGWADDDGGGDVSNLPNPKLSRFCAAPRRRRSAAVQMLFVSAGNKRYQTRFNSSPQGALNSEYFNGQLRFLAAVTPVERRTLRFRPRPGPAHPLRQWIADKYTEIGWEEGRTYYESLADAALVVVDHPGSAMLEPLALDIPTVLFWDPRHWEMRSAAEPYFDLLRAAGVLHDSPEAAAAHFCTVITDGAGWWQQPSVQRARQTFVRRFALVGHDWQASWLARIRAEVTVAEQSHARRSVP